MFSSSRKVHVLFDTSGPDWKIGEITIQKRTKVAVTSHQKLQHQYSMYFVFKCQEEKKRIDLILGDLLQPVFSVVSAPDNTVQSKLVSLINVAGF